MQGCGYVSYARYPRAPLLTTAKKCLFNGYFKAKWMLYIRNKRQPYKINIHINIRGLSQIDLS